MFPHPSISYRYAVPLLQVFLHFFPFLASLMSSNFNHWKEGEMANNNENAMIVREGPVTNERWREENRMRELGSMNLPLPNSPFASSSGWAGKPPTSTQLCNTYQSPPLPNEWLVCIPSSSSDSSEEEDGENSGNRHWYKVAKLADLDVKKEDMFSYLCSLCQGSSPFWLFLLLLSSSLP